AKDGGVRKDDLFRYIQLIVAVPPTFINNSDVEQIPIHHWMYWSQQGEIIPPNTILANEPKEDGNDGLVSSYLTIEAYKLLLQTHNIIKFFHRFAETISMITVAEFYFVQQFRIVVTNKRFPLWVCFDSRLDRADTWQMKTLYNAIRVAVRERIEDDIEDVF